MATAIVSPAAEQIYRSDPGYNYKPASARHVATAYDRFKLIFDVVLALVLLVPASPLILLAGLLIKLTSRGPIFYSQLRVGRDGIIFRIWKLRTMSHDCERHSGACWSTAGDPRITPVGRFLRKTHLDELPQLWNVLRGDMGLVGPRPERPEFVSGLELQIPGYRGRLVVRPGLTGLAQVQLPADMDIESVRRKLAYDLWYIERRGLWLDFRLILSTALKVAHLPFWVSRVLFRIPSPPLLEPEPVRQPVAMRTTPQPLVPRLQPDVA